MENCLLVWGKREGYTSQGRGLMPRSPAEYPGGKSLRDVEAGGHPRKHEQVLATALGSPARQKPAQGTGPAEKQLLGLHPLTRPF